MASRNLTGYGPSSHPMFDGDEQKWEQWECRFLAYMKLKKLKYVVASEVIASADKREEAFSELVQCLDERSLNLIIRDAKDDGRKAMDPAYKPFTVVITQSENVLTFQEFKTQIRNFE